jgi:hypothetical protein
MGPAGTETPAKHGRNTQETVKEARNQARSVQQSPDPDLSLIVQRWPGLSPEVRRAVVSLVSESDTLGAAPSMTPEPGGAGTCQKESRKSV